MLMLGILCPVGTRRNRPGRNLKVSLPGTRPWRKQGRWSKLPIYQIWKNTCNYGWIAQDWTLKNQSDLSGASRERIPWSIFPIWKKHMTLGCAHWDRHIMVPDAILRAQVCQGP